MLSAYIQSYIYLEIIRKIFEKSSSYQRCQLHHHDGGTQRQPNTQTWLSQPGDYQYIYIVLIAFVLGFLSEKKRTTKGSE